VQDLVHNIYHVCCCNYADFAVWPDRDEFAHFVFEYFLTQWDSAEEPVDQFNLSLLVTLFVLHQWLPAEVLPQISNVAWPLFDINEPLCWLAALNLLAPALIAGLSKNPFDIVPDFGDKWLSMFERGLIVGWQSKALLLIWLRWLAVEFPADGRFLKMFTAFHGASLMNDNAELLEKVHVVRSILAAPIKQLAHFHL
jgi:hypothetical protein